MIRINHTSYKPLDLALNEPHHPDWARLKLDNNLYLAVFMMKHWCSVIARLVLVSLFIRYCLYRIGVERFKLCFPNQMLIS